MFRYRIKFDIKCFNICLETCRRFLMLRSFKGGKEDKHRIEALSQGKAGLLENLKKGYECSRLLGLQGNKYQEKCPVCTLYIRCGALLTALATVHTTLDWELSKKQSTYLKRLQQQKEASTNT